MKGIELPINVLVIVAIAVIVLLGLVVVYFVGYNPFSGSVTATSIKNKACSDYAMNYNCGRGGTIKTNIVTLTSNTLALPVNSLYCLCVKNLGVTTGLAVTANCAYTPSNADDVTAETRCEQLCGC